MDYCEICGAKCPPSDALVKACLNCSLKPVVWDAWLGRQIRLDAAQRARSQSARAVDNRLSSKLSQLARRVSNSAHATDWENNSQEWQVGI